jgi:hypothetical protein
MGDIYQNVALNLAGGAKDNSHPLFCDRNLSPALPLSLEIDSRPVAKWGRRQVDGDCFYLFCVRDLSRD